jgi:hypothetical protein
MFDLAETWIVNRQHIKVIYKTILMLKLTGCIEWGTRKVKISKNLPKKWRSSYKFLENQYLKTSILPRSSHRF